MGADRSHRQSLTWAVAAGLASVLVGCLPHHPAYQWLLVAAVLAFCIAMARLWWRSGPAYALVACLAVTALPKDGLWAPWAAWLGTAWMLAAIVRWLWTLRQEGLPPALRWPLGLLALACGWALLGAAASPEPLRALTQAAHLCAALLGGLACAQSMRRMQGGREKFVQLAVVLAATLAAASLLRYDTYYKAASSPFWADTNLQSAHMAFLLPMLLWWLLGSGGVGNGLWRKVAGGACLLVLLLAGGLFQSRGAWLSLIFALALLPLALLRRWPWRLAWVGLLLVLGNLGLYLLRNAEVPYNPYHPAVKLKSIVVRRDFSNNERRVRWACAWRMAADRPLLGHGAGRFAPTFKDYLRDDGEKESVAYWHGWRHGAHNDALNLLAETGWPGLLAFAGFVVLGMRGLWRRIAAGPRADGWALALWLGLLTWLAHGCFNDLLATPGFAVGVAFALGWHCLNEK